MGEFKKGDFVRVKLGHGTDLLRENNIYEVLGHSDRKYPIVAVTCSHGDRHELDYEPERFTLYRSAATPTTLKIEAGKFYKTRDGRKVGPAFISGNTATFGSTGNYASAVWSDDGRSSSRDDKTSLKDNDIIAEWIDEPAAKASNDNAQPNFKVGDRVRGVINPIEYEVLKVHANGSLDVRACGSWCQYTNQRAMDFVNITRATTIVAIIENGQPKPSSTPHVHTSTGAAETEAKRLAAKYKGKQFGVFTLTTTHEEAAPVYDHKWQNMAAMGLKIDAIKELRAVAGLDLASAKSAVEVFIDKAA